MAKQVAELSGRQAFNRKNRQQAWKRRPRFVPTGEEEPRTLEAGKYHRSLKPCMPGTLHGEIPLKITRCEEKLIPSSLPISSTAGYNLDNAFFR